MTLVEAMLCIVLLGATAAGISALYVTGFQSLDASRDGRLLDGHLRSKLEELIATPVADLHSTASGSENVVVGGQTLILGWTATPHDLDGDSIADADALLVTASLAGRSLSVVLVDHRDHISKIP